MGESYIVKDIDGNLFYDNALALRPESAVALNHPIRLKILKHLSRKPMYPAELASKLGLHEQKVYYHIRQMEPILEVIEKKEIRGTTAKKFAPRSMNFSIALGFHGKTLDRLEQGSRDNELNTFLQPFISNQRLNTKIVVGSPDPHGPFKARARDGHYAIELALFLGSHCTLTRKFSTMLDVDLDLKKDDENLILVGGPVTNLLMAKINDNLPAKFSEKRPWGIKGKGEYTDESIGLIAKIPHPFFNKSIMVVAGIRYAGTRAAVLALTRYSNLLLSRYTGQKEFYSIVEGYDLDSDGKIDGIEILE